MGFLDFIKSIFKEETKEEIKPETVSINELPNWVYNKSESISSELNDKLNLIKNKIKQEIESTKDNLKKLASAELRNPNITLREKQFMQGNREAYTRRVNIFVDRIVLPNSPKEILSHCTSFDKELQSFGKSTARPYHILQEFFGNESREVALNIKNLDKHMKELRETIKTAGLDRVEKIKEAIEHLVRTIAQKKQYDSEVKQAQKNIEDLKNSKDESEAEIKKFKESNEFLDYEKLKNEKEKAAANLEEHKKQLLHSFAVLERALKKFQRIAFEDEKLIESYIQNPVAALEQDNELRIIGILNKLEHNARNDKLDLKDKKKDKTIAEIRELSKDFFISFLDKYAELKNKFDEINNQLHNNKAEEKLMESNKKIEKIKSDIETKNKDIAYSKQELEKIDISKLKSSLEKEIKNLNVDIKINIPQAP
ncbi:hypothetical protein KY360_05305 [Candidatus Woesearchaeota archaeon]|nr:hypothetical protein [Candidatus Woesearchaeota archaeon]